MPLLTYPLSTTSELTPGDFGLSLLHLITVNIQEFTVSNSFSKHELSLRCHMHPATSASSINSSSKHGLPLRCR